MSGTRLGALTLGLGALLGAAGCGLISPSDGSAGSTTGAGPVPVAVDGSSVVPPTLPAGAPLASAPGTTVPAPSLDPTFDAIAARTTMTPEARELLARSSPELTDRSSIGQRCSLEPDVSVLGCYQTGHIAVLSVTDPRLDGITETTTAHEMLHAAWASLGAVERSRLVALLQAAYQAHATAELSERLDVYRAIDPAVIDSELHSILGTEVAGLGPDLEAYYTRWFTDRSAVVTLAQEAQGTFSSLRQQVDDLDAQLAAKRAKLDAEDADLRAQRADLDARSAELDSLRAEGRYAEYNAGVDPFNTDVAAFNSAAGAHQQAVDGYNDLVVERNQLAAAYTDLAQQINTTVSSISN
ncbi:MAG: hypothetical protein OEY70_11620 [Acidimicrobiia bacterium]|nr:hypothetical protein [Acidimicrobiia bacterium]